MSVNARHNFKATVWFQTFMFFLIFGLMCCIASCGDDGVSDSDKAIEEQTGDDSEQDSGQEQDDTDGNDSTSGEDGATTDDDNNGESQVGSRLNLENIKSYYYISGGGTGDGSDWANAAGTFPSSFERGKAYIFGPGTYGDLIFDTALHDSDCVYFLRAGVGLADEAEPTPSAQTTGIASFSTLSVNSDYFYFDGLTPGKTKFTGSYQGAVVGIQSDHVHLANSDIDGAYDETGGYHTGGACSGMGITGSNISIIGNDIHDAADDGAEIWHVENLLFKNNTIRDLKAHGTDGGLGPCYNGHSDGLELNRMNNCVFNGNYIYNVPSTSAVFFLYGENDPDQFNHNIIFRNNVFYNSLETGFVAYLRSTEGLYLYNNIFWGRHLGGGFGGIAIGTNLTDFEMKNNILVTVNYSFFGVIYDASEHDIDYNFISHIRTDQGLSTFGPADIVGNTDPEFVGIPAASSTTSNPALEGFRLESDSVCRSAGTAITDNHTDVMGNSRSGDYWDLGVFAD